MRKNKENKIKSPKWNGALGEKQMSWIKEKLQASQKSGENVVFYCHFPVYPKESHVLWNSEEVIKAVKKVLYI